MQWAACDSSLHTSASVGEGKPVSLLHEVGHEWVSSIRDVWKDVNTSVRATDF